MNKPRFKVGDKVRIFNDGPGNCSNETIGYEFIIAEIFSGYAREFKGSPCGVEFELLELVSKKGKKEKPRLVNFLLKYDLDEDPIEEFETMDEVRKRIDYLVQNERSLKRESMVVYTIKKKQKVSVSTRINLK